MRDILLYILTLLAGAGLGLGIQALLRSRRRRLTMADARDNARRIVESAEKDAQAKLEAATLEIKLRLEAEEAKVEEQTQQRAKLLDERQMDIERREKDLSRRIAYADENMKLVLQRGEQVARLEKQAAEAGAQADELLAQQRSRLEQIAGCSAAEARDQLRKEMELDARRASAVHILRIQEEARDRAAEEARWITTQAIQRIPTSQHAESTVTLATLPGDDMKGRIIGREGRNIRAIEMGCGIDLIIDDTPGVITLSSFDPKRRMVAKLAIERLVEDGRIHPARIEEVIAKVKEEFEKQATEQGEAIAFEMGIHDLNPRLVKIIGRLQFVTYHGQSVLDHSREVAALALNMATVLSVESDVAKRAGFLHKIGFGADGLQNQSPLSASAEMAQRLGEAEPVVHCIRALYGIVAPRSVEAVLLQVAERASVSRPGAQKPMLEKYLQHLQRLEEIATSFPGVKKAYAVRAGKEIRVIASADETTDKQAVWLSKDIAARIEKEVKYPGQLRVSVIRETRSVGFAM